MSRLAPKEAATKTISVASRKWASRDLRESRRVVGVSLPVCAWDFLELEADCRNRSLSGHVSDMLLTVLQVGGYVPRRERLRGDAKMMEVTQK